MQLNNAQIFLNGVDGAGIVAGLDAGEFNILDEDGYKFSFFDAQISSATLLKRFDGVAGVHKVVFTAPALPTDCCEDTRCQGISVRLIRNSNPHFDHETYLDSFGGVVVFSFPYEDYEGVAVTEQEIAIEIARQINHKDGFFPGHPYSAVVDPTDNTAILITEGHPDIPIKVYAEKGCATNTITVDTVGQPTTLDDYSLKRRFPLLIGSIPGADTDRTWQGGKNPAVITLIGGTTQTLENLPFSMAQNAVHNYGGVVGRFAIELWLNCDEAGYAAFYAALDAALTATITDVTPV